MPSTLKMIEEYEFLIELICMKGRRLADVEQDLLEIYCKKVIDRGLATGNADTIYDLFDEVLAQLDDIRNGKPETTD